MKLRKPKKVWEARVCRICGVKTTLICPCGTARYCSKACQEVDWKQRGHREACKQLRGEQNAEATRGEEPSPEPERLVFYGPAPRSRADEERARIKANFEAARAWREANPEPEPLSVRRGKRCSLCFEDWDVNIRPLLVPCCCVYICVVCNDKIDRTVGTPCYFCRMPAVEDKGIIARLRRHADKACPDAVAVLGRSYADGSHGLVKSPKKALKLYQRAAELGDVYSWKLLGDHYYCGWGVKSDRKKAVRFYRIGAEYGEPWAQNDLALCYERGVGVLRDLKEAKRLYALGAAQGLHGALANLQRFSKSLQRLE